MSTGCVRSPPETAEHRLMAQEHLPDMEVPGKHCSEALDPAEQPDDQEQKKPRRKDTPVLTTHPLIPGVRLMRGEKRMIHLEDKEKEGKN